MNYAHYYMVTLLRAAFFMAAQTSRHTQNPLISPIICLNRLPHPTLLNSLVVTGR